MDTLAIWGFTTDAAATRLNMGAATPLRTTNDLRFRVKNTSTLYAAKAVTVSLTGPDAGQLYLSLDGITFTATAELGDLAATATSAPIWLRRVTPSTAALGAHTATVQATPTAWVPTASL